MVGEMVPAPVDTRTADREFWMRYHAFRRVRQQESRPDDPVLGDAEQEAVLKRVDPFTAHERFEVARDGATVGWLEGSTATPRSPEYETSKHLYDADVYVLAGHRRHGIGTAFLQVVVDLMRGHGATTLSFWAEEDSGHEFMKWIRAEPKLSSIESRVRLSEVDWPMLERWAAEGQARSPHTRLEVYDGPVPEAMWADYAPQLSSMLNTIPFENLDHGEIIITPETMREWYARMELTGNTQHTVMTREPDGVISGVTDVIWAPYHRTIIHQQFTGVRPNARGRGLGKWMKAAMLLHLRPVYPNAEWVWTDNAGSNAPMLKINRAMGFKEYRHGTSYQIARDDLERRLATL